MIWLILGAVVAALMLATIRATGPAWAIVAGGFIIALLSMEAFPDGLATPLLAIYVVIASVLNFPAIRRKLISDPLLGVYRSILPAMSQTEQEAIDAGTVWWDGELFSGRPNWNRLLEFPKPSLTAEEQAFLANECEQLCAMTNDWETTQVHQDLSPQAWQFIKDKGFLGMIIPRQYGGKGFSAFMHSQVIVKLSTRCSAAAVSVMVPNSLGPAELLLHYGTESQRNHYLPRLARGLEIPCFSLTNPNAGSDAAAIPDVGIICKGQWQGNEVLGMRVTWDKRYITLGPIATLLGLAVGLHDPDHLLGDREDLGITCLLVPTDTAGVNIGRRHMPLDAVFQNGPNWGKDVFMPLEWIIGGKEMAGQGWRMLMECLATGRSISLPSSAVGCVKLAARATGAYARVRSQFNTAIGKFEGVEEALARIGGNLYLMDAARTMTAGAVDQGEKPSVISAVAKYHLTERGRAAVNDAMDILGGKGICLGPSNFMGRAYQQLPIAITVEGANILTRCLIIFGQGAIRAHPYVLSEMNAAKETHAAKASTLFDQALWGHVRFAAANEARAFVMALSGSRFASTPDHCAPETRRYYRHLTRFSAAFAFLADVSMLVLGGKLKRREKLSARLGDILSLLYLGSCTLKRYEDEGRKRDDLPLLQWAMEDTLTRIQAAINGVLDNYPNRLIGVGLRCTIFPLGQWFSAPSDELGHRVARLLIAPSATRDRLTAGMHIPKSESEVVAALEAALDMATDAEAVGAKIRAAAKSGALITATPEGLAEAALAADLINSTEHTLLARFTALRDKVIAVDHFPQDFGRAEAAVNAGQRAAA